MASNLPIAIVGWLGVFLVLAVLASILFDLRKRRWPARSAVIAGSAILPLVPIFGLSISQYFLTIVGHLSITSMVLLGIALIGRLTDGSLLGRNERTMIYAAITAGSLLIFPATFGLVQFNGYQLGFGSITFTVGLAALALIFALSNRNIAFLSIAICVLGFELHLLESNNLWDYLFDPLLAIYSVTALIWRAGKALHEKRKPTEV